MLDDLTDLRLFVKIATLGSLTAAARDQGLALNVASKRLAAMERRLGVTLVQRTTRRSTLTEEGDMLLESARSILRDVDDIEARFSERHDEPHGLLRIGAPAALGRRMIAPLCAELADRWPALKLELHLSDRLSGLLEEKLDVVIRIGAAPDSGLIMRKLAQSHRILVASPAYLARHGTPQTPQDMTGHAAILYGAFRSWDLVGEAGQTVRLMPEGRLHTDSGDVAHDWARLGMGLALKSEIDVADDLASGALVRVLPDWKSIAAPVLALYPSGRHVPRRLRVFLDTIAGRLTATGTS